jgi:hypothetical protein
VLAYRLKINPRALERLMNALVALGLLNKKGTRFSNTPEADAYLVESKPTYLGGQVEHLANLHWRLWQYLPDAIREGTPRLKQALGPGFDAFEAIYQDPQALRGFIQGMHSLTMPAAQEIADAFEFALASRLLRSPFLGAADSEMAARARLDARLRERLPVRLTLARLRAAAGGAHQG